MSRHLLFFKSHILITQSSPALASTSGYFGFHVTQLISVECALYCVNLSVNSLDTGSCVNIRMQLSAQPVTITFDFDQFTE